MNPVLVQRLCAWSAVICVAMFFAAFVIPGFLPPPGPYLSQDEVVAIYVRDATSIRIGFLFMLVGGMFVAPFSAMISFQMRRIDSSVSRLLAYTQLSAGSIGMLTMFVPAVMFLITAYRPERSPELTYMMNDASWMMTVIIWPPFFMQNLSIGIAVLLDKSRQPIFPRWFAFFQFWVALMYTGATLLPFFKSGPFAWNGVISFWVPAAVFAPWFCVTAAMLLKAIGRGHDAMKVSPVQQFV